MKLSLTVVIKDTSSIVQATSELLSIPPHLVKEAVDAQFEALHDYFTKGVHPNFRLEHLGEFRVPLPNLRHAISTEIRTQRSYPSDKRLERIKRLYALRVPTYEYQESKKFKKRFGTWH